MVLGRGEWCRIREDIWSLSKLARTYLIFFAIFQDFLLHRCYLINFWGLLPGNILWLCRSSHYSGFYGWLPERRLSIRRYWDVWVVWVWWSLCRFPVKRLVRRPSPWSPPLCPFLCFCRGTPSRKSLVRCNIFMWRRNLPSGSPPLSP